MGFFFFNSLGLEAKDVEDVLDSLSAAVLVRHDEGAVDELLLLLLQLHHLNLDRFLRKRAH